MPRVATSLNSLPAVAFEAAYRLPADPEGGDVAADAVEGLLRLARRRASPSGATLPRAGRDGPGPSDTPNGKDRATGANHAGVGRAAR